MGCATNAVISNRGYSDDWFWWGFFFGFIAFMVAFSKPEKHYKYNTDSLDDSILSRVASERTAEKINRRNADIMNNGGWTCKCGNVNSAITLTCACGNKKEDVLNLGCTLLCR